MLPNFNVNSHHEIDDDALNKINISSIGIWLTYQRFSNYKYTFDEFVDAMRDPVINHYYFGKMQG